MAYNLPFRDRAQYSAGGAGSERPGERNGDCNGRGGTRAWDFGAYDRGDFSDEEPLEFDPLWGGVDAPASK